MKRSEGPLAGVFWVTLWLGFGTVASGAQQAEAPDTVAVAAEIPAELAQARNLMANLRMALDSVLVIEVRMSQVDDEEREVLRVRGRGYVESIIQDQQDLLDLISKLQKLGLPVDEIRSSFTDILIREMGVYERYLKWLTDEIDDWRGRRSTAAPEQMGEIESRIDEGRQRLDANLAVQVRVLTIADSLGLNTAEVWEDLDRYLTNRAEHLVGRLQVAANVRDDLEEKIRDAERARAPQAEVAVLRTRLQNTKRSIDGIAKSLQNTSDLLDKRGFETTRYRQFAIRTTGEITGRILDPKVLIGLVRGLLEDLWGWLKSNAPTALVRVVIVLAFVIFFRLLFRLGWWLIRIVGLAKLSRLMSDLVQRLINPFATVIGLLTGLWFLGANPTTLLAGLGVAGVIVGFALQDSLSNLAAGFFILFTRPFDVDDVIQSGNVLGTVKAMGLANTTIMTFDNRRLLVPNRRIWGEVIENRSAEYTRRVDLVVRVGYEEDLDRAIQILGGLLEENDRVLRKPEPAIFVLQLAESWIEIAVRPWVRNEDWWPLLTELPRLVRLRFAEEGIDIPVPRRDISLPAERFNEKDKPSSE